MLLCGFDSKLVSGVLATILFLLSSLSYGKGIQTDDLRITLEQYVKSPGTRSKHVVVILETSFLDKSLKGLINSHSGKIKYSSGNRYEIHIQAEGLQMLIERSPSTSIYRRPFPHSEEVVVSQGVNITGAVDFHSIGNSGSDVRIGVIDLGFDSYQLSQASGDLPSNLTIIDYTGTGTGGSNHGTIVAETVHDMAPGAQLYLAKVSTTLQLEQAVLDFISSGVSIINHSVAWYATSFYDGTGYLCDIASHAEASGVMWFNSMGNSRYKHYLGLFNDSDGNLRHEFSPGQNYNTINLTSGSKVTLILNWDDYPLSKENYNLYLYNGIPGSGGTLVASSQNSQSGAGSYPFEIIEYTPSVSGTYYIVVSKTSNRVADLPITLFSIGPGFGVNVSSSSLAQPADCQSVISVAATSLNDDIESFSAEGPTTDGRMKPDISAPDGTSTSLLQQFFGTSASSPHAAGAAALIKSKNPYLTVQEVTTLLINTAKDISPGGYDYRTGYGRISLDADSDGINHDVDNCLFVENIDQSDLDSDGIGDVCDDDIDGDGLLNSDEAYLSTDQYNDDTDNDGLKDGEEIYKYYTDPVSIDTDQDGLGDYDEIMHYKTDPVSSNKGYLSPKYAVDNSIDVSDLLILIRIVSGIDVPDQYELISSDINNDSVIDIRDILKLRQDIGY